MARGYRRLSLADEDEIWSRLDLAMRLNRQLVLWGCRRGRCGPIWCGVAGSGPIRGDAHRVG